ncbi:hypothetical protein ACFL1M_02825 [Patescibacteria group bacterium]
MKSKELFNQISSDNRPPTPEECLQMGILPISMVWDVFAATFLDTKSVEESNKAASKILQRNRRRLHELQQKD